VDALDTWLCTLLACDWTLSITLLTLVLSLSSLPQPVAAIAPMASAAPAAASVTARGNLLDWLDMGSLLSAGWNGARALPTGLY
jgi:hypothetical protein